MAPDLCVCMDIGGALLADVLGDPLPGASDAVTALRRRGVPVRFVTNTTSRPPGELVAHLRGLGLLEDDRELYTPFTTAQRVLEARGAAAGLLIATPEQRRELAWFEERGDGPSVLLATEGHALQIADLQPAFRALLGGARLYALEVNRYWERQGQLVTDVGPLAAFLEYAADTRAEVLGKPSRLLFETLADEVGVPLSGLVMVGDDAEFDVARCIDLGLRAVLLRTGKYRTGDEHRVSPAPTATLDGLGELDAWLRASPTPTRPEGRGPGPA